MWSRAHGGTDIKPAVEWLSTLARMMNVCFEAL